MNYQVWQVTWGSPRGFFVPERGRFQSMFLVAILFHTFIFGTAWKMRSGKKIEHAVVLQSVDLIEPEIERDAPPAAEAQPPKSAFEFLKMAIPIFRKPAAPEIRDVTPAVKRDETKIAEPERLIEKKTPLLQAGPEIKLSKSAASPQIAEIARVPQSQRADIPLVKDPSIKLEEVGRRAVAIPQTPSISLDRDASRGKIADISAIPSQSLAPRSAQPAERLVDRSAPSSYSKPVPMLGYQPREGAVSLDGPRDVARAAAKPVIEAQVPKTKSPDSGLSISKEKVRITGPLSSRKVVKSYVPEYPAWARAKNIEADVAISFTVSPSGGISGKPAIERTSGYSELDQICLEILKQWKFSPLAGEQDQWGVITFRFTLD